MVKKQNIITTNINITDIQILKELIKVIKQRYPNYVNGKLKSVSYGCPDLKLMGYRQIKYLLLDMVNKIKEVE